MSRTMSALANSPWLAVATILGAFLLLFSLLLVWSRTSSARPETTRKLLHAGSGLLTLTFPFLFREMWPVLLLTGTSALLIGAARFVPSLRDRFGCVTSGVNRPTFGELYFPLSVALLFFLTRGEEPLLFVIPVLVLTLADATCALVGGRYGLTPYASASKSLEGSVTFVVVAFFCVHVPLLLWGGVGRVESLLLAATLSLLMMLLEGSAWRGLDNVSIPIGGYVLLRVHIGLDAATLFAHLVITLGLVLLILLYLLRRRADGCSAKDGRANRRVARLGYWGTVHRVDAR